MGGEYKGVGVGGKQVKKREVQGVHRQVKAGGGTEKEEMRERRKAERSDER